MHPSYAPTFIPYIPDGDSMYYVPSLIPPSHPYTVTYATPSLPSSVPALATSIDSQPSVDSSDQSAFYTPYQAIYYQSPPRPQNGSYQCWYPPTYTTSSFIPTTTSSSTPYHTPPPTNTSSN